MKTISELIPNKPKVKEKGSRKETWYGDLGKEMTEYFGTNCYWLPHKYEQWKLRAQFKAIQNHEDIKLRTNFAYFLGMLKDNPKQDA